MVLATDPVLSAATSKRRLGATYVSARGGTDFTFYTDMQADGVELCLFDKARDAHEVEKGGHLKLAEKDIVYGNDGTTPIGYLWHGFVEGVGPGMMYGFRVHGEGHNPNKLLVDPAADAVSHDLINWEEQYHPGNNDNDGHRMPKARIIDWQALKARALQDDAPQLGCLYPHADTIISETHIIGSTKLNPNVPEEHRGTISGLVSEDFISWMKSQHITSLELQPIATHGPDYWGYSTMVGGAVHTLYASEGRKPEEEFVDMVRILKKHGIEVILDVVPNHTIEGGDGAAANLRQQDRHLYRNWGDVTGCGNTRDFNHPINRRMFIEELHHWRRCGVAGFRIDLAGVLGCEWSDEFNLKSTMMEQIRNDQELQDVKIYGEPWHIKGQFRGQLAYIDNPEQNHVAEWNNDFRDLIKRASFPRKYGRDDADNEEYHEVTRADLIEALAGSNKRFPFTHSGPQMSLNYVFSHDFAALWDAVSSQHGKNNWANGENNNDGNDISRRWYHESEDDRERVARFQDTLLTISQGGIMRMHGNESLQSQGGNTNPWNQNNEITWRRWGNAISERGRKYSEFISAANKFRLSHPVFRRGTYLTGKEDMDPDNSFELDGKRLKDGMWLDPSGHELVNGSIDQVGGFGMLFSGDPGNTPEAEKSRARKILHERENPVLVLINPTLDRDHEMEFTLPNIAGVKWKPIFNSLGNDDDLSAKESNSTVSLGWHTIQIFQAQRERDQSVSMTSLH